MRRNLIPKAIERQAPPIGATSDVRDPVAFCKLYMPDSHWTWYMTEYDPATREAFGLVHGEFEELGYFSLDELSDIRGPMGLTIQRDLYWKPRKLSEVKWS